MVIKHSGEKVVRSADGVEIAREMKVDILHGDDLRVAAACGTALYAEHGAEGGLTQSDHNVLADLAHAVCQTDGRRGLTLACGGGGDGGHENELSVGTGIVL